METETATLSGTIQFVLQSASAEDLDRILAAAKQRHSILGQMRAAAVSRGMHVMLSGLSPKCLNGLLGKVEGIAGKKADVRLCRESTDDLRWARQTRFNVADEANYVLRGVPLQCLQATEAFDMDKA